MRATQPRQKHLSAQLRRAPTRYELVSRVAAGGMAEVWRANAIFETGDGHPVAVKRVLQKLASDPVYRAMFEDEARLGMLLRHPNIVRVYDARHIGSSYIMIMELVDGTSLQNILKKARERSAGMPVATALYMTRELANALDYAHRATSSRGDSLGIIHRDVSPHNLLLSRYGEVKLTDFGLADASVHQTRVAQGMVGGKLGYLAPEIIHQRPATPAIDIFAAGIVLWEALAGRRLFLGDDDADTIRRVARCEVEPASRYNSGVTPEVDELLFQLLAPSPEDRVPSAAALVQELGRLIALVDPEVGPKDLALLVGLHLAAERHTRMSLAPPGVDALLAQELAQFAAVAAGTGYDVGAAPLNPDEFEQPLSSGLRIKND